MGIEPKNLTLSLADSTPLAPVYPLKSTVSVPDFGLQLDYGLNPVIRTNLRNLSFESKKSMSC